MITDIPQLVKDDCWLEGNTQDIIDRNHRFHQALEAIEAEHGSLEAFASAHNDLGINLSADGSQWAIREWAPAAKSVALIGPFNDWSDTSHALALGENGIWELYLPSDEIKHEDLVKLRVHGADDSVRDRIPAYIRRTLQDQESSDFSGQIWNPATNYEWQNDYDVAQIKSPLIYEAHTGMAGEEERLHTYREFADNTLPRIKELGYNCIQLMAVQEHPYYGSFGYHVSNFFAASSRFGTPEDLKYLIDTAHGMGIGVLLDIVHSHAVKNYGEGLNNFDGSGHQYFHEGDAGEHPQWDSKCFDYSKPEVQQFLLSNVRFWLEEFRFDGFRFDGITSMLYHHHGSIAFDHYDKYFRDGVDFSAVTYLQLATELTNRLKPGALIVAEDMSGMPGLSRPISEGGVGFTHRLAMGLPDYWIKLLKHQRDEDWNLNQLWDTMLNRRRGESNIAYAESHDQALVGDKTVAFWLMDKEMYWHMAEDDDHPVIDRGMALHKMIRLITASAAGEGYLTFMGNEFGHPEWLDFPREGNDWSFKYCRRQWSLVDHPGLKYRFLNAFDSAMIHLLKEHNVLTDEHTTQLWIQNDDKLMAFRRGGLIFVFNFHPTQSLSDYSFAIHDEGEFELVLDSDASEFGGHSRLDSSTTYSSFANEEGCNCLSLYIPCRTALVLKKKIGSYSSLSNSPRS